MFHSRLYTLPRSWLSRGVSATSTDFMWPNSSWHDTGKLLYFERSPPWHYNYCVIVSDSSSGSIYGIYFLTFYSGILFWHSIWHLFWHPIWHPSWHQFWHFLWDYVWHSFWSSIYLASILKFFPASLLALYLAFYLTVYSGIPIWHLFWHSVLPCYLTFFLAYDYVSGTSCDIPSGILSGIYSLWRFFVVEVRRGTLWSWACGGGPAGGDLSDPEVAVRVQSGPLRSRACSWGPEAEEAG